MQIVLIVLGDFRKSDEALCEDMRAGDGNVSNVAGGERVALGGILRIDLISASGDLDMFVDFFGVIYGESEFVGPGSRVRARSAITK